MYERGCWKEERFQWKGLMKGWCEKQPQLSRHTCEIAKDEYKMFELTRFPRGVPL